MKKELKDWFVPWLFTSREYNVGILDQAMANPDHARLMLNENPIGPSEKVIEAVVESLRHGNWYPDSFLRLRTKIGKMYGLGPDNVALANGSSDTIDTMMRLFLQPGDEFLLSNPTFELFPTRADLCNAKVVQIPVREDNLDYDVDAMLAAINDRTKLILIINPNNPTGVYIDDADLERFCETGVPLCVDEAYLDYNPDRPSKAYLIEKYPQVFLSVTFSKAYGFCGIRFGFVLGTEEMIAAFNRMFLPWNVSRMAAAAAEGDRSENAEYIYGKKRLREIDSRVRFLNKRLDELEVVDRAPADTSKVFFGAWVTLEDEEGEEQRWRIVGPDEFELADGKQADEEA